MICEIRLKWEFFKAFIHSLFLPASECKWGENGTHSRIHFFPAWMLLSFFPGWFSVSFQTSWAFLFEGKKEGKSWRTSTRERKKGSRHANANRKKFLFRASFLPFSLSLSNVFSFMLCVEGLHTVHSVRIDENPSVKSNSCNRVKKFDSFPRKSFDIIRTLHLLKSKFNYALHRQRRRRLMYA